jgi:hypothetical protein
MVLGPLREINTRNLPGVKDQLELEVNNLTATWEPIA